MTFINIGFGNLLADERVVAAVSPDSAPIKRIIQQSREAARLIDATYGRKCRCVLVTDSSHVVLSAFPPERLFPDAKVADLSEAPDEQ